ncbi:MAG: TldD/PmbA family protein, partial [Candidatus Heimdallarchaeota archaeon]
MTFDTLKDDLLSLADTGLKYAKAQGADQAEIFVSSQNNVIVRNQSGMIDARDGLNEGVGVRVAIGKKIGFAAMSGLTDDSLKHAVSEALSVSKSVNQDNVGFDKFIAKAKPANDGLNDPNILSTTTEDIVKSTTKIFKDAQAFDKRIISVMAQTQTFYGGHAVVNTEGASGASDFTAFVLVTSTTAMEGQVRKSAFDFSVTRDIPNISDLGSKCAEKSIKLLDSKPLGHTGVLPTVWNPLVMSGFWQTSLISSINGRQVVEKNSYFMDKLGDKVGIDSLNITDDGQLPEGLSTSAIDAEGAPRQQTKIVENGVLRSFLYDSYYGKLGKAKSTGNASRGQDYESTPTIAPSTLVIQPGTKSLDDIIGEIDKGVYVTDFVMGMGHSNLISGDFSIVATAAYHIEKGEITHALNPITIA